MPEIFKKHIKDSETAILNRTFQKMDDLELDIQNTQDLIQTVGKGIIR